MSTSPERPKTSRLAGVALRWGWTRSCRAMLVLALTLALPSAPPAASADGPPTKAPGQARLRVAYNGGLVDLEAKNSKRSEAVTQLAEAAGFQLRMEPEALSEVFSDSFKGLSLAQGIRRILEGWSYVLTVDDQGKVERLALLPRAGDSDLKANEKRAAAERQRRAAQPEPPPQPSQPPQPAQAQAAPSQPSAPPAQAMHPPAYAGPGGGGDRGAPGVPQPSRTTERTEETEKPNQPAEASRSPEPPPMAGQNEGEPPMGVRVPPSGPR